MKGYDLHTHTIFCDGKNTPEEMVKSAIDKGLNTIGILAHSYCECEPEEFLHYNDILKFQSEVNALKEKYKGQINVLCGVEQDLVSPKQATTNGFDYVIGSIHYFMVDGKEYSIDLSEEDFVENVKMLFNGDYYLAAENYYENLSKVVEKTGANIIAHFDLMKKYNVDGKYFDEKNVRYVNAYKKAVDKLALTGALFEINVGCICRKVRHSEPYPSKEIFDYILSKGGKFVYGSDSHSIDTIGYAFNDYKDFVEYKIKGIDL